MHECFASYMHVIYLTELFNYSTSFIAKKYLGQLIEFGGIARSFGGVISRCAVFPREKIFATNLFAVSFRMQNAPYLSSEDRKV
jgi:hypothetical protein